MNALRSLSQWPVGAVASAVVTGGEVCAVYGDQSRVFALASVTKLIVAQAVLVACAEEAISLSDPVGPPGATVRHLLAHASGLAFDSGEIQAGVAQQRIYSSYGFELLAAHVTDATGIAFADYLDEAICQPLSMTATGLRGPAGHGAESSVADLAVFAAELLSPQTISPELHAEAVSVAYPGLDGFVPGYGKHRPNDWGLGFEIRSHKHPHWTGTGNSPQTYGHFGQSGTFLWVDPVLDSACVVLTDRPFGAWAKPLWADFNDLVIGELMR